MANSRKSVWINAGLSYSCLTGYTYGMKYKSITVRIPEDLYLSLDEQSRAQGMTFSDLVRQKLSYGVTVPASKPDVVLPAKQNSAVGAPATNAVELDDDGFPKEDASNPYKGWWVIPDPNGSIKGWLDEAVNKYLKVITNGRKEVRLYEDDPLYNKF